MLRNRSVWRAAVWFGVILHLSWHLGRPAHQHRSFGLWYHWVVGVVAALPAATLANRRFRESPWRALALILGLGVFIGQGLEPLGEVIVLGEGWGPLTNPLRWRVFGQFLAAALGSGVLALALMPGRRDNA